MRIKVWTWSHAAERLGPYVLVGEIDRAEPLSVGDNTTYGNLTIH